MSIKVKRMVKVSVDTFQVGDIIKFKLTNGAKVQAMAMQQEENGMIFCLIDCLPCRYPMNIFTNEGGYEKSDLRKSLNAEILDFFPEELKAVMVPFENGDLLRIPTEREIFGENQYGDYENPYVKQWKPMKKCTNRIAADIGVLQQYWLVNKARESTVQSSFRNPAAFFTVADCDGRANYNDGIHAIGVRPVFKIKNL